MLEDWKAEVLMVDGGDQDEAHCSHDIHTVGPPIIVVEQIRGLADIPIPVSGDEVERSPS